MLAYLAGTSFLLFLSTLDVVLATSPPHSPPSASKGSHKTISQPSRASGVLCRAAMRATISHRKERPLTKRQSTPIRGSSTGDALELLRPHHEAARAPLEAPRARPASRGPEAFAHPHPHDHQLTASRGSQIHLAALSAPALDSRLPPYVRGSIDQRRPGWRDALAWTLPQVDRFISEYWNFYRPRVPESQFRTRARAGIFLVQLGVRPTSVRLGTEAIRVHLERIEHDYWNCMHLHQMC